MHKYLLTALIPLILISCFTHTPTQQAIDQDDLRDSLSAQINAYYQQNIFNGFAVSIVNEAGTLYQQTFGSADVAGNKKYTDNTVQPVASVSKTLVGIALLKAQELKKLHLDDPINQYLPFKVSNPHFPDTPITLRQLATHTSSIADNEFYLSKNYILKAGQQTPKAVIATEEEQVFNPTDSLITMSAFLENILNANGKWYRENAYLNYAPGTTYEYSNVATAVAALVLEKATGQSFQNFTHEYILKPLNMNHSGWTLEKIDENKLSRLYSNHDNVLPVYRLITYPDGGFTTSIDDLSKFLTELIRGYNGNGTLLTKESYQEYFRPQLTAEHFRSRNTQNPYNDSYNVGIFIGFGPTGYIGHTGGDPGVVSILFFHPESGLGRILLLNTNFSDKTGNDAFYGIWNLLETFQTKLH